MTTSQERRLHMFRALLLFCITHQRITDLNLSFKRGVIKLQAMITGIDRAIAGQRVSPESAFTEKKLLRATLCESGAVIGSSVFAWAVDHEDVVLEGRIKWRAVSILDKLSDESLLGACRDLLADAEATRDRDPGLDVTEEELLQFESSIGLFAEKQPVPRNTTSTRSRNTKTLGQLMTSTNSLLRKQLDKAALKYKKTHPEFYLEYLENRKVLDVPTRPSGMAENAG
ncbi:MAG: hypothetical protein EOO11_12940 [Chitinophagaceae bacterium]|nr:MAG: hypothetical protein EOO11_12940 [Chitinophagaceae bacterium]